MNHASYILFTLLIMRCAFTTCASTSQDIVPMDFEKNVFFMTPSDYYPIKEFSNTIRACRTNEDIVTAVSEVIDVLKTRENIRTFLLKQQIDLTTFGSNESDTWSIASYKLLEGNSSSLENNKDIQTEVGTLRKLDYIKIEIGFLSPRNTNPCSAAFYIIKCDFSPKFFIDVKSS